MRSLLRLSAALAFATLAVPAVGHAQLTIDRESVMLDPTRPGERVAEIVVRNAGETGVQASVLLEDWETDVSGASRWMKPGKVAGSCGDRVSVSPRSLKLAPGEQRVVRIAVRTDAQFDGECWSAAVVESAEARSRSAVPLYVTPSGLDADGEMSDLHVRGDSLEIAYRNTGKLRTEVIAEVQVRTASDSIVAIVPIETTTVLAGSERRWRVAMPKLAKGTYTLFAIANFGGPQLTAVQAALEIR